MAVELTTQMGYTLYLPLLKNHYTPRQQFVSDFNQPTDQPNHVMFENWAADVYLAPGESFTHTFTKAGEYPMRLGAYSTKRGTVFVQTASPVVSTTPDAPAATVPPPTPTNTPVPTARSSPTATQTSAATATPVATSTPTSSPTPRNTGDLIIKLDVDVDTDQDFTFTVNDETLKLDNPAEDDKDGVSSQERFLNLSPTEHTITYAQTSGYVFDKATCISNQPNPTVLQSSLTLFVTLRAAEVIECTFFILHDTDGDRLPDAHETNDGSFSSITQTGTDPNDPDTDKDGLYDGDEVLGTEQGLALASMGANPLRKTIFIEYDWYDDSLENEGTCNNDAQGYHTHRPSATMVAMVESVYAGAPVQNPDGSFGIDIIQDYGQGGLFAGGNLIAKNSTGLITGNVNSSAFRAIKATNFSPERRGYFHYAVMAHQYDSLQNFSSGNAEINGDDLIVSLYNYACNDPFTSQTVVHELGHNLGLLHGGNDRQNYKPNYNSVMNYRFQFAGVDTDCDIYGNGVNGYSTGERIQLNEANLQEGEGVCGLGSSGFDWNTDGDTNDTNVRLDVNLDGAIGILNDHNDWGNLYFLGILFDDDRRGIQNENIRPIAIAYEPPVPSVSLTPSEGAPVPITWPTEIRVAPY